MGTECSGLESVMAALDRMALGRRAKLRFICEKDPACRKIILGHRSPDAVYDDITLRPVTGMPTCDLYAAGFPCQPWSAAGLGQGEQDKHGRGRIFGHILDYLCHKTPKCYILENVKGIATSTHRAAFHEMLTALRAGGRYLVSWRVLNTADYGLPQNRPRVYIIGVLRSAVAAGAPCFKWPPPDLACQPLAALPEAGPVHRAQPTKNTTAARNLEKLASSLARQGVDTSSTPYVLDIFASKGRSIAGKVPCLTRTRAGSGGYWVTSVAGLLTTREMLRLQGLPERLIDTARTVGVTDRQLRQMIGNAMSVNLLVVVLNTLLRAVGVT